MQNYNRHRSFIIAIFVVLFALWNIIATVRSSFYQSTFFPSSPIQPTLYQQMTSNWCGPGSLQSAIQWVNQYNNGTPVATTVPIIPKATLWAFMRDNTCLGRDVQLTGTVGDGFTDVRKMNISYDFGVDPHALAWTMYMKTPIDYYYHYWIYYNSSIEATRWVLYTLEQFHEPIPVAVFSGSHWVLIIGYEADVQAYPGDPGIIYYIKVADPLDGIIKNISFADWTSIWFTPYTHSQDPDPATGWYIPPPEHWRNHWVSVERDYVDVFDADWAMSMNGPVWPNTAFIPLIIYDGEITGGE